MSEETEHDHGEHDHAGHEHDYEGHDHEGHDHEGHDHDHALIVDRLPEGAWQIDPASSEVLFKARALFGLLPVTGAFERFTGEMIVDPEGAASGRLVVETASINSGIRKRDADLRSASYFDSDKYPEMTFTLEKLEPSGEDHLNVTGTLLILHTSIPVTFPAYAIAHGDHLHLEGGVTVDHDVAGLGWAKPALVGKRVRAEAALTLTRVI
ncbi:MAG TPA: YceI family protein [Solirubrobacteraceae bacterium]|nr:YceI family protein [Solirubrobacteraceae bacterium]